jgi:hypothetical protein
VLTESISCPRCADSEPGYMAGGKAALQKSQTDVKVSATWFLAVGTALERRIYGWVALVSATDVLQLIIRGSGACTVGETGYWISLNLDFPADRCRATLGSKEPYEMG